MHSGLTPRTSPRGRSEPEPEDEPDCKTASELDTVGSLLQWLPFVGDWHSRKPSCCVPSFLQLAHLVAQRHRAPTFSDVQETTPKTKCEVTDEIIASKPTDVLPGVDVQDIDENGALLMVQLDVGFGLCSLKSLTRAEDIPVSYEHDFQIEVSGASISVEGLAAFFNLLDFVLELPEVETGFIMSFDFRCLYQPKLDLMVEILRWSEHPDRQASWSARCRCWKIVASGGASFTLQKQALNCFFHHDAPPCDTYLVTDMNELCWDGCDAVCFMANQTLRGFPLPSEALQNISSELISGQGIFSFAVNPGYAAYDLLGMMLSTGSMFLPYLGETKATPRTTPASADLNDLKDPERPLPASMDTGLAVMSQWYNPKTGLGELKLLGQDCAQTQEGLQGIMDFMDAFTNTETAANGFCITYDLRQMRVPSMSMIMAIAEWGNEPVRKDKWERMNKVCKIVMCEGLKLTMAKGILSSFFYICPPVCRTFLLTDPDEPEECAYVFEPLPSKGELSPVAENDPQASESTAESDVLEPTVQGNSDEDTNDARKGRPSRAPGGQRLVNGFLHVASIRSLASSRQSAYTWTSNLSSESSGRVAQ